MLKRSTILAAIFVALAASASPALAQETGEKVNGTFRLTLNGEAPENVSFWVETSADGEGGVICTTDAAMVESGINECEDGGAVNEMYYAAPAGGDVEYRIVGSQGAALSQQVIAEGSTAAEEGFVIEASYTFSDEPVAGAPEGTGPDEDAAEAQYGDDSDNADTGDKDDKDGQSDEDKDSEAKPGVLPDTGGASPTPAIGALLLIAAGGFLAYRIVS